MNTYYEKLAKVLVNYSADVQEGMTVCISGLTVCEPAMMEVYKECLRVGAHPIMQIAFPHTREHFYDLASDDQLDTMDFVVDHIYRNVDRMIQIWGDVNTKGFSQFDPQRLARSQKVYADTIKVMFEREQKGAYKWALTGFPTDARAQDAGMALHQYEDFIFKAALLDKDDPVAEWKAISAEQKKICEWLTKRSTIRYVGLDTDITFSTKGRKWINCDGHRNFPDGEVYTCPLEDSANGTIRFTYPMVYMGNEIEDVMLTFKDGVVTEATAAKGQKLLNEVLEIDAGARRLGELAIGTNYGITRFTKNMLYDEKIGGTVHLALGRSADPEGGKNESSIHLDILKDMKGGGKIYADGELIYENGVFIIDF